MRENTAGNGKNAPARVGVVAAGVVSPMGFGLGETLDSLREARDCITRVTRFSVTECRCRTAGQVPDERLLEQGRVAERSTQRLHRTW